MKTLKIQRMEGIYAICADAEKKYYAIAQAEAYQGQITVEDDGRPEPGPGAENITLDMLAVHEERLCMLELTTTTV